MKKRGTLFILIIIGFFSGCNLMEKKQEMNKENLSPTPTESDLFQQVDETDIWGAEGVEVLKEKLEVKENNEGDEYNVVNRMGSHNGIESLFCIDGNTGVVYFVNQKQDYFIYRLKDGKSELAVPLPAEELYMWDGKLYFMIETYDIYTLHDMNEGDIYVYSPAEGTVELVYPAGAVLAERNIGEQRDEKQYMTIEEDGIYFVGDIKIKQELVLEDGTRAVVTNSEVYHLPFGSMIPEKVNEERRVCGWENYFLGVTSNTDGFLSLALIPRETDKFAERIYLQDENGEFVYAKHYFVLEDELFYLSQLQEVKIMNLKSGETKVYDVEPLMISIYEKLGKSDFKTFPSLDFFTVTKDSIWILNSMDYLFQFDRQDGSVSCYKLNSELWQGRSRLYTDGSSNLYVVTAHGVARVVTEKTIENVQTGVPIVSTELLVE